MSIFLPKYLPPVQLRLPLPIFQKSVLIYGAGDLPEEGVRKVQTWVGRAKYKDLHVITGDGTDTDSDIARLCAMMDIPIRLFGVNIRPRNGASTKNYTRLVQFVGKPDRLHLRDMHMVQQADTIVCVWDGRSAETLAVYNYARTFKTKKVYLSTHAMPWIKVRKRSAGYVSNKEYQAVQLDELIRKAYPNVQTNTYIH